MILYVHQDKFQNKNILIKYYFDTCKETHVIIDDTYMEYQGDGITYTHVIIDDTWHIREMVLLTQ